MPVDDNCKSSGGGEPDESVDIGEPGSGEFMVDIKSIAVDE